MPRMVGSRDGVPWQGGLGGQSNFVTVGCLLIYYWEKQIPLPNKEDGMVVQGISGS
jgi:hypothetical protein